MQRLVASFRLRASPKPPQFVFSRQIPPPRRSIPYHHFMASSQLRNTTTMAQTDERWKKVAQDNGSPSFSVFEGTVQKSEKDDRDYRLIKLENGLKAMLIHDPTADKAAASLDVAVGHLHDPVSTPPSCPVKQD